MRKLHPAYLLSLTMLLSFAFFYISSETVSQAQTETLDSADSAAASAAPSAILFSYQGQLLDSSGDPVNNAAIPMTFKLFTAATGGTACWTEDHTGGNVVNVANGQFHVLLGQISTIPASCLTADAYLELAINGETLSPREILTSVAHALEASTLEVDAVTQGGISLNGSLNMQNNSIENVGNINRPSGDMRLEATTGHYRAVGAGSMLNFIDSDNNSNNAFWGVWSNQTYTGSNATQLAHLNETGDLTIKRNITAENDLYVLGTKLLIGGTHTHGNVALHRSGRTLHLLPWGGSEFNFDEVCIGCGRAANLKVNGSLNVLGSCTVGSNFGSGIQNASGDTFENCQSGSIISGAYIESNLMTEDEKQSERIERFVQGDLLCWEAETQQLQLCTQANDRLVMGVADINGKPIVLGAEYIKVLGPIEAGDILVSSNTPGYATVNNTPAPGTVIGQALDILNGDTGLIKVMIRKW